MKRKHISIEQILNLEQRIIKLAAKGKKKKAEILWRDYNKAIDDIRGVGTEKGIVSTIVPLNKINPPSMWAWRNIQVSKRWPLRSYKYTQYNPTYEKECQFCGNKDFTYYFVPVAPKVETPIGVCNRTSCLINFNEFFTDYIENMDFESINRKKG